VQPCADERALICACFAYFHVYFSHYLLITFAMQHPVIVSAIVSVTPQQAWHYWTTPDHITRWNAASDDWHTPRASVDLRPGGSWMARMEARDGSMGFDLLATIEEVRAPEYIRYILGDGRAWDVRFESIPEGTLVTERFEAENIHARELQQQGWSSIMARFKRHAEARSGERLLRFETEINANPQNVFDLMLAPESYQAWTSEFNPSSRYEGSWSEGAMIRFLGEDKEGKTGGMVSRIRKNVPAKEISIEHLGLVLDGKDVLEGEDVRQWAGAIEHYAFETTNGKTKLVITLEAHPDFADYFEETWPKALARLKEIAEAA
jgi:uncharacterized protein YndB with AHSA1/START domain